MALESIVLHYRHLLISVGGNSSFQWILASLAEIKITGTFNCEHCGKEVLPLSDGSYRNHCPYCLYSKHVDIVLGDRLNHVKDLWNQ